MHSVVKCMLPRWQLLSRPLLLLLLLQLLPPIFYQLQQLQESIKIFTMKSQCMEGTKWQEKLVAFEAANCKSMIDLIHYCKDYLRGLGVKCTLAFNTAKSKTSVQATLTGDGGATEGGIIFSGYACTVPVDGEHLESGTFSLIEGDRTVSRRGATCDIKGLIAACVSLTPKLLKMRGINPLHFAWVYDEEAGTCGANILTQYPCNHNTRVEGCTVAKQIRTAVEKGQRGVCIWRIRICGKPANSLCAEEDDDFIIIDYAARLIMKIRELAEEIRARGTSDEHLLAPLMTDLTNHFEGHSVLKTLPGVCEFTFEFCSLPFAGMLALQFRVQAHLERELLPEMRSECLDGHIEVDFGDSLLAFAPCVHHRQQQQCDPHSVACVFCGDIFAQRGNVLMKVDTMPQNRLRLLNKFFSPTGDCMAHL